MTNMIVVLPRLEDARNIKNILVRNGFHVVGICTTGAQAVSIADGLNDGIVISGYKLADMLYSQLNDYLPCGFDLLLLASRSRINEDCDGSVMCLPLPLQIHDLLNTVSMMDETIQRRRRKKKERPKTRRPEEEAAIRAAKELLMERNHMTEEEAHRYLQKCSMDSGTNLAETAQMVLAMMKV
jgi:response regulator NasT